MAKKRAKARASTEGLSVQEAAYVTYAREVERAMPASEHTWQREAGQDVIALAAYHNRRHYGPRCTACGYGYCVQCYDGPPVTTCPAYSAFAWMAHEHG